MTGIIGQKITGAISNYIDNSFVIFFEDGFELKFVDCAIVLDAGVINGHVIKASKYKGDMGFVVMFREFKHKNDDYSYFIINTGNNKDYREIRIAYKLLKYKTRSESEYKHYAD